MSRVEPGLHAGDDRFAGDHHPGKRKRIVDYLGNLSESGPVANNHNPAGKTFEHRSRDFARRRRTGQDRGQLAFARPVRTAADRHVECGNASGRERLGNGDHRRLADGRGFDIDLHGAAAGNALCAGRDLLADFRRWKAGKYNLRAVRDLARRSYRDCATIGQRQQSLVVRIADHQCKAANQKTLRHGSAHVAASDEAKGRRRTRHRSPIRLFLAQSNFSFNSSDNGSPHFALLPHHREHFVGLGDHESRSRAWRSLPEFPDR